MSDERSSYAAKARPSSVAPADEGSEQVTLSARLFEVTSRDGGENGTN
jgi:hypothetical protein